MARPKLSRSLAVANRETLAPTEDVALTAPPYPGWTPEVERRRSEKGKVFDTALRKIQTYLRRPPSKLDMGLVARIARDMDPERFMAKGGTGASTVVNVVFVDEGA